MYVSKQVESVLFYQRDVKQLITPKYGGSKLRLTLENVLRILNAIMKIKGLILILLYHRLCENFTLNQGHLLPMKLFEV